MDMAFKNLVNSLVSYKVALGNGVGLVFKGARNSKGGVQAFQWYITMHSWIPAKLVAVL